MINRYLIFPALLLAALVTQSQTSFLKGYYIGNDFRKTGCFIRACSWRNTPAEFAFRMSDTSEVVTMLAADVREFAIEGGYRFVSADVDIDVSSDDPQNYDEGQNPFWSRERVFLMVLVDGEATLYQYFMPRRERYFFSTRTDSIRQLVFKHFRTGDETQGIYRTNVTFRQQLWSQVRQPGLTVEEVNRIEYEKSALIRYFIGYNKNTGGVCVVYSKKREPAAFHLRITPGLNYSSLEVYNDYMADQVFDFGAQAGFRIGLEAELIFPYTHKKLGLVLEPSFQYFNGTASSMGSTMVANINTIEFPIGFRYYFFLGGGFRIFVNGLFVPAACIHPASEVKYEGDSPDYFRFNNGLALGAGMNWKRLGAEIRYYTNRKAVNTQYLSSRYARTAFILSFRLF